MIITFPERLITLPVYRMSGVVFNMLSAMYLGVNCYFQLKPIFILINLYHFIFLTFFVLDRSDHFILF